MAEKHCLAFQAGRNTTWLPIFLRKATLRPRGYLRISDVCDSHALFLWKCVAAMVHWSLVHWHCIHNRHGCPMCYWSHANGNRMDVLGAFVLDMFRGLCFQYVFMCICLLNSLLRISSKISAEEKNVRVLFTGENINVACLISRCRF